MNSALQTGALLVDVQNALSDADGADLEEPPSSESLNAWANVAYAAVGSHPAEVTIRLCGSEEITQLNRDYRGQDNATNVLSFPVELDAVFADALREHAAPKLLGDIVLCHPVIVDEARAQNKSVPDHYAHMVIHGLLHLCGHDHQNDIEAQAMESLEIRILANAHIANPYQ